MPRLIVRGADLYFEDHGTGPEAVVFAHGLLLSCRQFDGQVAALRGDYRCVAYDARGHGQSGTPPGGYDLDSQTEDAAALIRHLGCGPCHFVGFSMGGFVGQRLAVRHPELLHSLTLIGSSASPEPNALRFRLMGWVARLFGVRAVTSQVMAVQFSTDFLRDPSREEVRRVWFERIAAIDRAGALRAADAVNRRPDYATELGGVRVPTLILVGGEDRATPPEESKRMHARIAGSELTVVPGAGHAITIEHPEVVGRRLRAFLVGCASARGGPRG